MNSELRKPPAESRQLVLSGNKVTSEDLFSNSREISIIHNGETYRLKLTGNNRLILNK